MHAKFYCKTGLFAGKELHIVGSATIGTHWSNSLILSHRLISGRHASIRFDEDAGSFLIEDLRSRNGVSVDGIRVRGRERLDDFHVVTLAKRFNFFFQAVEADPDATDSQLHDHADTGSWPEGRASMNTVVVHPGATQGQVAGSQPTVISASAADLQRHFRTLHAIPAGATEADPAPAEQPGPEVVTGIGLEILTKLHQKQWFPLQEGPNSIGRFSKNDVCIENASLSREHARIVVEGEKIILEDAGSTNHTFVHGERVASAMCLKPGMRIRFGWVEARLTRRRLEQASHSPETDSTE